MLKMLKMLQTLRTLLVVLVFAASAAAQNPFDTQGNILKKEAAALQTAVDSLINSIVPGGLLLEPSKVVYLDGYGMVVTLKVALATPRGPFNAVTSPADVKKVSGQRLNDIRDKLLELLKQQTAAVESVRPAESISIAVFIMNTNPADLPGLPSHVVFSIKKQDAVDFGSRKIADLASRITVREFP